MPSRKIPDSRTVDDLQREWAACQGSQKGQYSMSHHNVGKLFAEIDSLKNQLSPARTYQGGRVQPFDGIPSDD